MMLLAPVAFALVAALPQPLARSAALQAVPHLGRAGAGNRYLWGPTLTLDQEISGDLFAAGGVIHVDHAIGEDAVLAAGDITIDAPVGDDLRAVGGTISVDTSIGGEAFLAAGKLRLGPHFALSGPASLDGGEVSVMGTIAKSLSVSAQQVTIDGAVLGDTRLIAQKIRIGPGARLNGALTYASETPIEIDRDAHVGGPITREPLPEHRRPQHSQTDAAGGILWWLGLVAAGTVSVLAFQRFLAPAQGLIKSAPWQCLGLGAAIVFATPLITLLALITIVGVPLALIGLLLYALALFGGYFIAAEFVGTRFLIWTRRRPIESAGSRALATIIGLTGFGLLDSIAPLGCAVTLLALLFGIGAGVLQLHRNANPATN